MIGREREPVVVVDDFVPDPGGLRMVAAGQTFAPDTGHYPGLRAPVTPAYLEATGRTIAGVLREVFGSAGDATLFGAWYQIVTTQPAALSLVQRVPHFDAVEPGRVAIVHYLSLDDQGGTSFYRHRSTGFETIGAARSDSYFRALNSELASSALPTGYMLDGSPSFECTATFESRYNRALIYRSHLLHSGAIRKDCALSRDPLIGRLTVGVFLGLE